MKVHSDIDGLSFSSMKAIMRHRAKEYDLTVVEDGPETLMIETNFGQFGVAYRAPDGLRLIISAAKTDDIHVIRDALVGQIASAVPEFADLFADIQATDRDNVQDQINLTRRGQQESLLVRMAQRRNADGALEGYVVAFDDVTDLVSAQRMAAWGDVARRIAHEIKNPLTPIQLSAERIKRKFSAQVGDESAKLDQMTDVIVRQTNDLRRIVDEFSKFARMPEPTLTISDLKSLVYDAVTLQKAGQPGGKFIADLPKNDVLADMDSTMISQALTNLIKNAGEATQSYASQHNSEDYAPEVRVSMQSNGTHITILIADNGVGLPEDRARLFEPYVTTRENGTGLGLPIVKKIIEEHGGVLTLTDADIFEGHNHAGACAIIQLPALSSSAEAAKIPA